MSSPSGVRVEPRQKTDSVLSKRCRMLFVEMSVCPVKIRLLMAINSNKKFRYREEHSASVVLGALYEIFGRKSVDG